MNHRSLRADTGGGVLRRVRRQLTGLFDGQERPSGGEGTPIRKREHTSPALDLIDRGDAFVVLVDLPGFRRDDVRVSVVPDRVDIEAVGEADPGRSGTYLRRERRGNTMTRSLSLPELVEVSSATTRYRSGVLQVVLPKVSTPDTDLTPVGP